MSMARILGASTRKSEPDTRKAHASLRVMGDDLNPEQVTRILRVVPTVAYSKGERYGMAAGRDLIGHTGLWLLSTERLVASDNLQRHLAYLLGTLVPGRQDVGPLIQLHALLAHRKGLKADISCFWHGRHGAKRPSIPKFVTEIAKLIPAEVESDFDTDSEETERRRA